MIIEDIKEVFNKSNNELDSSTFSELLGIEKEQAEEILKQGCVHNILFEPIREKYSLISQFSQENVKEFQEFLNRFFSDVGAVGEIKRYADVPVSPVSEIQIKKPVYDGIEKISYSPLEINKIFKIYIAKIGEGHSDIFIITNPNENLFLGLNELRLKKMNFLDLRKIAQNKNILPDVNILLTRSQREKLKNKYGELDLEKLIIGDEIFFFKKIPATSDENLIEVVKKFGFDKINNDFLEENSILDKSLKYIWRINLLNFGNKCQPEISKYNNHSILITNTKTGKSTHYNKISDLKFDSAKSAGLIGFSTADRTNEGSLNNQYQMAVLDDFASANYEKEILDNLPSILENGKALISKGKEKNLTKCSSIFSLTTNSNPKSSEKDLMLEFSKIITKLSETPQRLGSRFGLVLFGNKFLAVKSKGETEFLREDIKINEFITKQIFEKLSVFAGKLIEKEDVQKFLEKENNEYKKLIEEILKNGSLFGDLRDFWKSTIAGYRHQNGFALKQGIVDYFIHNNEKLIEILKGEEVGIEDIKEILEYSKENLKQLNDLNLKSLRNLAQVSQSEKEYLKNRFKGIKQDYLKELVKATFKLLREKPNKRSQTIKINELEDYLDKNSKWYGSPSKILEKIPQNLERINREISIFELELLKQEEEIFIQIYDRALEISYTKLGENGEFGENGE